MKHKFKQKVKVEINLDEFITGFKTVDAIEIAELRGIDPMTLRPITEIARTMSREMLKSTNGSSIYISNPGLKIEIRGLLVRDLSVLGLEHDCKVQCVEQDNQLTFIYIRRA